MKFTVLSICLSIAAVCTFAGVKADQIRQSDAAQTVRQGDTTANTGSVIYEDWFDKSRNRKIPVKIYMPVTDAAPYPVVIFSHGLGGSREAAKYLGEYWSKHGFIGVFVQHSGSDESVWLPVRAQGHEAIMSSLKSALNVSTFTDRVADIKFVLDEIGRLNEGQGPLHGKFDHARIAIAGHSYGANTSLTMAGQEYFLGPHPQSFLDPRIKAAIYLSPPANLRGHTAKETFGDIKVPGLLMTGTEDNSPIGSTTAEQRRIPFDGMTAANQYLVIFDGGDHMLFNGAVRREAHPGDEQMLHQIERVTTAFLDAYVNGDKSQKQWLDNEASKYVSSDAKLERK